uniref:Fas-binding factor 1 C-terminal domain-containing protein n=1 Tax=Otus sunia TaxID=257818 RepID=A0A8C8E921_9STRI
NLEADLLGASRPGSGPGKTTVKDATGYRTDLSFLGMEPQIFPWTSSSLFCTRPDENQCSGSGFGWLRASLVHPKPHPKPNSNLLPCVIPPTEPPTAEMPLHTTAPAWRRKELTFEEDGDDLMAALGLGSGPGRDGKQDKKAEEEEIRPARAKLDELLGRGSVAKMLEEPGLGERRDVKLAKEYQKQPEKEEGRDKDDFVFGAYQPTVASTAKGWPARRQPLRFSAEKNNELKAEPLSKAPPSASQCPARGRRNRGAWLGLKHEDFFELELSSPAKASPAGSSPSLPAAEEAAAKSDPVEEEEDWLSAALSRKKAQAQAKAQERTAKLSEVPGEGLNPRSPVSQPAASPGARPQAAAVQDKAVSTDKSPALGLLHERRLGAPAAQPHEDATGCQAALLRAQDRVAELESQVRTLELARAQDKLLMESLRQRHEEDLDLLQSTHRSQVKVLEETCRQREQRLQQEKEQLLAQLLEQRQEAEQARAELEQRNALELERLREQQRVSVQELRREHEEQLQRLKWLKDQEVDAVTSATSYTRTLNGVMDQMEKFSSNLRDILQEVEATHQTTSHKLAMRAQMQEKQLKVLQDRLSQQQRDTEEERRRFQEVVAKMEARLEEQTRLLEQERQRVSAERSRAESLEEERRVITQQLSEERAELERAKSALLEEQKSVTQKHTEEQQKLVAKWSEFHTQQPLSKEQDTARMLPMDSQGEGPIRSLAKERAEVKIRVRTLRAQEEQLAREKELLDEAWQELKLEKEKVNEATLRVQQQEEEMKSVTKVSGASALPFPAAHGLAAKLGFHSPAKAGTEGLSWKGKEGMHKGV